jgi:gamma-glutamyltranspeptidase
MMANHFATHRPLLMSTNWMITADHPLAVHAGAAVLESGGNAVDAAVVANIVMTIVRPHMCGIGGDLFMLVHMASKGTVDALNASGRAPTGATMEAYQGLGYRRVPETGIHSCTVPGALAGWQSALEKHGSMGLDTLLARAIPYARDGFPVYPDLVNALNERRAILLAAGAAGETFLPGGVLPRVGQLMVQPKLAQSYQMLMKKDRTPFTVDLWVRPWLRIPMPSGAFSARPIWPDIRWNGKRRSPAITAATPWPPSPPIPRESPCSCRPTCWQPVTFPAWPSTRPS